MTEVVKMIKGKVAVQGHSYLEIELSQLSGLWLTLDYFRRYLSISVLVQSRLLMVHIYLGGCW